MNCEHKKTKIVPSGNAVHHSKMICADCSKFLKWMRKPVPPNYQDNTTFKLNEPGRGSLFGRRHVR